MKSIKYVLMTFLLLFISCELDVSNPNEPTENNFWTSQSQMEQTLTATYSMLQMPSWGRWGTTEWAWSTENFLSDAITIRDDRPNWIDLHTFSALPGNSNVQQFWHYNYKGIFFANQIIEKIDEIEEMGEGERKRIIGEAKFLRAYYYYKLVNYYKNICLVTDYIENRDQFFPEQVPPEDVWNQIEKDLNYAVNNCLDESETTWPGQVSSQAASALLGKAHMQQTDWDDASTAFETVINSDEYSLVDDYHTLFTGQNENSEESIFEIQYSMNEAKGEDEAQPLPMNYYDQGWNEFWPHDWLTRRYLADTTASGEITERVWGSMTIGTNDPSVMPKPENTVPSEWEERGGDKRQSFKKYCYDPTTNDDFADTDVNIILMRYADILLLYAEAENEQGNTGVAVDYINQVRDRVDAVPLSEKYDNLDQTTIREHIRDVERPIELAAERKRWIDLLRWDKAESGYMADIFEAHDRRARENFNENKKYLPIPAKDVDNNPKMEQNPGY